MTTNHSPRLPIPQQPTDSSAHWPPKDTDQHIPVGTEFARLEARIRELEEALQAFTGVQFFSDAADDEVWQLEVTEGDLRRAREALYGRPERVGK